MAIILTIQPTDDIQNYLNILNSYGGGILNLNPVSVFNVTSTLNWYSNITLNGNGATIDFGGTASQIMAQGNDPYSTGTLSVNFGSTTVTGAATSWTTNMIGQSILIGDYWYEISGVTGATSLTLSTEFIGTNLSGDTYVIATPIEGIGLQNVTLQNSSITLLSFRYVNGFVKDSLVITNGNIGINGQDSANCNLLNSDVDTCVSGIVYNNVPFCTIDNNIVTNILGGTGINLTRVTNASILSLSIQSITGVGFQFTNCSNLALTSFAIIECTSHGTEFVSGNTDIDLVSGYYNACTGDGIRLTASSNRTSISATSFIHNTGYGVNIANANDNNNIIYGCNFTNNTAGNIHDLGTGTIATGNEGVANIPASSGVTSISVATANGLAGSSSGGSTPTITLSTTVTGILKGNGTVVSAAVNSDLPSMSATVGGAVPTPPNNTTTFLRGDGTFAAPAGATSTPTMMACTIFETIARYSVSNTTSGTSTFGINGLVLDTSNTISSASRTLWNMSATNSEVGNPSFSCCLVVDTPGTDFNAFLGLGSVSISGTAINFAQVHAGFKIIRASNGTITLSATQSAGTESATSLTTLTGGDTLELILKVNGTSSVDYYWRKNNGTLSSATNIATNNPSGLTSSSAFGVTNAGVASQTIIKVASASYQR